MNYETAQIPSLIYYVLKLKYYGGIRDAQNNFAILYQWLGNQSMFMGFLFMVMGFDFDPK